MEELISMLFPSIIIFLLTTLPQSHSQPAAPPPVSNYSICKESSYNYNCGNLSAISYPFWGLPDRPSICGGGDMFNLTCHHDLTTTIIIASQNFTVLNINPDSYTMTMKRTDLDIDVCSPQFNYIYLIPGLFQYPTNVSHNLIIFYNCSISGDNFFSCGQQHAFGHVAVTDEELKGLSERYKCKRHLKVPAGFSLEPYQVTGVIGRADLERGLDEGFQVKYDVNQDCIDCLGREGNCSWRSDDFHKRVLSSCYYCSHGTNVSHCSVPKSMSSIPSILLLSSSQSHR